MQWRAGEVDLSLPPDGVGDAWDTVDRGAGQVLVKTAHDFIDHATAENYDRWMFGADIEEGLHGKRFAIRPGTLVPEAWGLMSTGGVSQAAWQPVGRWRNGAARTGDTACVCVRNRFSRPGQQ